MPQRTFTFFFLFCLSCAVLQVSDVRAQGRPVFSQFTFNPYQYNPAFAGSEGYAALYLAHRRQWIGVEGAPVSSSLAAHLPLAEKIAVGTKILQRSMGALQEQTGYLSFAYILPFGELHNLRFGLSAGASQHKLSLSEASYEQQTYLANYNTQGIQPNFQFGINYVLKSFSLGLSLPSLNKQQYVNSLEGKLIDIQPLEQWLVSATYFATLKENKLALEPSLIYHKLDEVSTRIEGSLVLHAGGFVWAGASYRTDYGTSAILGFNLKKFSLGYSYEMGNTGLALGQSSHEVQARIQLGPEKTYSKEVQRRPRFEF